MGIEMSYGSLDDIPEMSVKELFTEKDGKMVFTGIEGVKTSEDVSKLEEALRKERSDHQASREKAKSDAEAVKDLESKYELLKTQKGESQDSEELQKLFEIRLENKTKELTDANALLKSENETFKSKEADLRKSTELRKYFDGKIDKVFQPQVEKLLFNELSLQADNSLMTSDGSEYGVGLNAEALVSKFAETNTHFAPRNSGGDAQGGSNKPATKTEQSTMLDAVNEAWSNN
jgi:hypothetical protein